ncbi:hypothetical protein AMJ49_04170 [Parcubacteria bacterium DG_74_2]|nr:MAG: hypothetical protein AMJ49_04170 [Parcubacteria bacterium DG_74_2]
MIFSFNPNLTFNVIRILFLTALSSGLAVLLTPILTHFLYKYKLWRKEARTKTITGDKAVIFTELHKEREINTPRFGGVLIWLTSLIIVLLCALSQEFNFLSRGQTWLPFFALIVGSTVGFFDDLLQVFGKGKYIAGGLSFRQRLLVIILIGLIGGAWFYFKLGWNTIHVPLMGDFWIGFWYIPVFVIVMLATWSGGIIDGLDGLAGGIFAIMFGAFGIIAFWQGLFDLAAFCAVIGGALLAFLWFNIPPARFYMGETGTIGLTSALAVVAFLTDSVIVLPIIAGLLVVESGSVILQLVSKKFRKKKIWLCTPIHHHFEAKGWPPYKVTMRFWLIGVILAVIGVAIRLLG